MDFYYPIRLHIGVSTINVVAPTMPSFANASTVIILTSPVGAYVPGIYVLVGSTWRYALSIQQLSQAIINGSTMDVFYNLSVPYTALSPLAVLYMNGGPSSATVIPTVPNEVWLALTPPPSSSGMLSQYELDYVATSNGAQVIPAVAGALFVTLFLNGIKQSKTSFSVVASNVQVPSDMNVLTGDRLTITYWM